MQDLVGQPRDFRRGLNAVVSFTDANPSTLYPYSRYLWDCVDYSNLNNVPIYSITLEYANTIPDLQTLGINTSGFYIPCNYINNVYSAYQNAHDAMDLLLHYLYVLGWPSTSGGSGTVIVRITVTYWTVNGERTDVETSSYVIP